MAYVLRKAVLGNWEHDESRRLTEDGLRYALRELRLHNDRLSVFLVNDYKSNIYRIAAALAATRRNPDTMEYFLLDVSELDALSINWRNTPMDTTPDDAVNCVHVDLIVPDPAKLTDLAQTLRTNGETESLSRNEVKQMITRGIVAREIDLERIRIKSRRKFWNYFYSVCSNC